MKRFLYLIATDQKKGILIPLINLIFYVLSLLYRCLLALRQILFKIGILRSYQVPCSVISVGNLTVGGTGKTPMITYLVEMLKGKGVRTAILTRGYMGSGHSQNLQSDEALMLSKMFPEVPVLVGANRVETACAFLDGQSADVFLLDDGFQHQQMARDLDIVVIDSTQPWGNGHLLPRGLLREPFSAIKRAQICVLTRTNLGKGNLDAIKRCVYGIVLDCIIVESVHQPIEFVDIRNNISIELEAMKGKSVCAVSSIGNPESFTQTLEEIGIAVEGRIDFVDHHTYTRNDIKRVTRLCKEREVEIIAITDKDAVKLMPLLCEFPEQVQIVTLKIRISITNGEGEFLERINRIL